MFLSYSYEDAIMYNMCSFVLHTIYINLWIYTIIAWMLVLPGSTWKSVKQKTALEQHSYGSPRFLAASPFRRLSLLPMGQSMTGHAKGLGLLWFGWSIDLWFIPIDLSQALLGLYRAYWEMELGTRCALSPGMDFGVVLGPLAVLAVHKLSSAKLGSA